MGLHQSTVIPLLHTICNQFLYDTKIDTQRLGFQTWCSYRSLLTRNSFQLPGIAETASAYVTLINFRVEARLGCNIYRSGLRKGLGWREVLRCRVTWIFSLYKHLDIGTVAPFLVRPSDLIAIQSPAPDKLGSSSCTLQRRFVSICTWHPSRKRSDSTV